MFDKQNKDIRQAIEVAGLRYWMIAEQLGISDGHFSRLLRHELPREEKEKIFAAIDKLKSLKKAVNS